jgi:type IV fimbrial biogenesis protein FimT
MVTIAVLAIIATMAVPYFGDMVTGQNLNKSTRDLTASLNEARSQAVTKRADAGMYLAPENMKYEDVFNNKLTAEQRGLVANKQFFIWIPEGKAKLKSGLATTITFNIAGVVSGANADTKFEICEKSGGTKSKIISISRMGTIQQITEGTC